MTNVDMSRPDPEGKGGFLDAIERIGNALPHPATLFVIGAALVMVLSAIGAEMGWSVDKPVVKAVTTPVTDAEGDPLRITTYSIEGRVKTLDTTKTDDGTVVPRESAVQKAEVTYTENEDGERVPKLKTETGTETVRARSLLSREGLNWAIASMVENFTSFHPLGVVLVAMLGIGVAEKTGCIGALLKLMMLVTPQKLLTPAMVFIGIMSSMAADAGYVILPPLAAALYMAVGRSPLVGLAAVFSGVAAGFSANLLPTALDPLLAGLTQEGAQIAEPGYYVNPLCNYYFMIVSTVALTLVGWAVTSFIVEPRYAGKAPEDGGPSESASTEGADGVSPGELKGLKRAGLALALGLAGMAALIYIPGAPLWTAPDEASQRWVGAIVPLLFILFLIPGVAYGVSTGTIKSETNSTKNDIGIAKMMGYTMADMGPYIVLAFFAAQFIEYFTYSNLGVMLAIVGGDALSSANMPAPLLLALFVIVVMFGNMFIGSASAKFAFFAPVFVPMFMQTGISPELTQVSYRVGDSITNIITPLNPYFIIILVFVQKYMPKAGIGTLVSLMLPYSLVFWGFWTVMLVVWILLGVPLGPDGGLTYTAG